jgi:molecular chaperone GrpE
MSKKKRDKKNPPPAEAVPEAAPMADALGEATPPDPPVLKPTSVEQQLADLQAERDEIFARLQRVLADYQNYQKRVQRDVAQARQLAHEEMVRSLLTVLDHMELALQAARQHGEGEDDPLRTGMQMVHDEAVAALGRFGLEVIEALGRPFDPELHAAMMTEPTDEYPPQTVVAELQKGYRLGGRTLRPTGVKVATELPAATDEPAAESTEE